MPINLDPNVTIPITLDSDAGIPLAERSAVLVANLTCRQHAAYREALTAADKLERDGKGNESLQAVIEALRPVYRGVRGDPSASDPSALLDRLTVDELWEVAYKVPSAARLDAAAKKASASPAQ